MSEISSGAFASNNHFALMGFEPRFVIDVAALESSWHKLQKEFHPDRYAQASEAERRRALQIAMQINDAYQMLKSPLNRAQYLLSLAGVDVKTEASVRLPPDFLMKQMEWREAIEQAVVQKDMPGLEGLMQAVVREQVQMQEKLADLLDCAQDIPAAAQAVRQWMFFAKLQDEIDDAQISLES